MCGLIMLVYPHLVVIHLHQLVIVQTIILVSPLGDSATNVYIGMVAHFNSHIGTQFHADHVNYVGQFPNASEMYYWGSPQEKMAVGGDAFIENRLSIGGTHSPDHPLDVTGI